MQDRALIINQAFMRQSNAKGWPRRDSNTQPSGLESDALPLRHGVLLRGQWWTDQNSRRCTTHGSEDKRCRSSSLDTWLTDDWNESRNVMLIRLFVRRIIPFAHITVRSCHSRKKLSIVFFGNDSFSLSSLEPLHGCLVSKSDLIDKLTVVTVSHSVVSSFARMEQLPLLHWPLASLEDNYDLGVVVSFGHLIPESMIAKCKYGFLNVHASLLPRWRGASPIHRAILAGDEVTGITVMLIRPHAFDVGPIVAQKEYRLPYRATTGEVHHTLAEMGGQLLLQTIQNLEEKLSYARPQPNCGIRHASKPKKSDGYISFENEMASEVDRKCRALQGLVDLCTTWVNGQRIRLADPADPNDLSLVPLDAVIEEDCKPGSIVFHKRRKLLCFKCKDGKWIGFRKVAMHGNKLVPSLDFYNGYMSRLLVNKPPGCKLKKIIIRNNNNKSWSKFVDAINSDRSESFSHRDNNKKKYPCRINLLMQICWSKRETCYHLSLIHTFLNSDPLTAFLISSLTLTSKDGERKEQKRFSDRQHRPVGRIVWRRR